MKSILFIHQSAELYGSDKTILMFISDLDKAKYFPVVVLPFDGPLKTEFDKRNIKVVIAPVLKLYRKMFTPSNLIRFAKEYINGLRALQNLHKQHHFELVYSHTLAALIGFLFARKNNIKHLWHVQEILAKPKFVNTLFKKLLAHPANNIAIYDSIATMNFWIAADKKLQEKSDFVWNGLDAAEKLPTSANDVERVRSQFFNATKANKVIALVGRINSWKGQQLLLSAYKQLAEKHPDTILAFIGSAPPNQDFFLTELQDNIRKYKLEDRVVMVPFQQNITQIWDSIDIAVVPSTEPEPFGMVAIEAMLSKKPVVAANHGGLTEIVIEGQTGYLFTPNDATALANAIEKLLVTPDLAVSFGEAGYNRAVEHFSLQSHVEKLERIIEDIMR